MHVDFILQTSQMHLENISNAFCDMETFQMLSNNQNFIRLAF